MVEILEMMRGAKMAVETCLGVKPKERVLIVTDYDRMSIAMALTAAAEAIGGDPVISTMRPRGHHGEEPPEPVAAAMKTADVVFIPSSRSLTHTTAREEATATGARLASMPGITEGMMKRGGMTADYHRVREDLLDGYVTRERAERDYEVVPKKDLSTDEKATQKRRKAMQKAKG